MAIYNGNVVRTDICDYGTCGEIPIFVVSARAAHVPGGGQATAERRPMCAKHVVRTAKTEPGTYELWTMAGHLDRVVVPGNPGNCMDAPYPAPMFADDDRPER